MENTMKNFLKLICILLLLGCLCACGDDSIENEGITSLTSNCPAGLLELNVGENDEIYFTVKCGVNFTEEEIRFVSEDETVVTAIYEKTENSRVYYKLTAVEEGETGIYLETIDGSIQSDYVIVMVSSEEGDAPDDVPGERPTIDPDDIPDEFENGGTLKPAN